MPLIRGFHATNIKKAFLLNAIAAALIASVAVIVKDRLDAKTKLVYTDKFAVVLIITFISAIIVYNILYLVFGFGGGMLTN
jgi:hypothetical protein